MLTILVMICAGLLIWLGSWREHLGTGWGYDTFYIAVIRMLFPFFAGLLLFRSGKRITVPMGFLSSTTLLLVLFMLPWGGAYNGLLEVAIIMAGFPLVVAIGAGSKINDRAAKLSKILGDISYPIYITHYPFIYIYTAWVATKKPTAGEIIPVAILIFVVSLSLAWAALKFYDLPVRSFLRNKILKS